MGRIVLKDVKKSFENVGRSSQILAKSVSPNSATEAAGGQTSLMLHRRRCGRRL